MMSPASLFKATSSQSKILPIRQNTELTYFFINLKFLSFLLESEDQCRPHLTMTVKNNSFHVCAVLSYCGGKNMEEVNPLMSSDLGEFGKCSVRQREMAKKE